MTQTDGFTNANYTITAILRCDIYYIISYIIISFAISVLINIKPINNKIKVNNNADLL